MSLDFTDDKSSGNKPLPQSMLTQIYVAICLHEAAMSENTYVMVLRHQQVQC